MASQIKPFLSRLRRYFCAYGGWGAILRSPLFLLAILLTGLGYGSWSDGDRWSDLSQSLIPNLLGFSLGTYAILFSLMTGRLKRALKAVKNERGVTFLEEINATFFHFIFVQVVALLWAFLYQGSALADLAQAAKPYWPCAPTVFHIAQAAGGAVGFALLVYSISLIVASALAVYRLALIVDPADE
ncbi:hypothetical protein D6851_02905 [Altericroceibacterium spongiae]|uniref:DUF2975 domain-containing protein n=1 Tax=Altericroceibacterium spongiae TaxID=2320269 RepID=A0A420ERY8_9SPHN|nr:hypothetical protein [Altericroceibacterium spongiae]RKF23431.1 hypothetical protein D6851_02905 [Altericroceibacterium spongiae]